MARVETWQCDVCNIQKTESNHWWLLTPTDSDREGIHGIQLVAWELGDATAAGVIHLCGASCVTKWLSESLL